MTPAGVTRESQSARLFVLSLTSPFRSLNPPRKTRKHAEIKAGGGRFAGANARTDVSVWTDFLWERRRRPHLTRTCFLSPGKDVTVSRGLGSPRQRGGDLSASERTQVNPLSRQRSRELARRSPTPKSRNGGRRPWKCLPGDAF